MFTSTEVWSGEKGWQQGRGRKAGGCQWPGETSWWVGSLAVPGGHEAGRRWGGSSSFGVSDFGKWFQMAAASEVELFMDSSCPGQARCSAPWCPP